jgi:hypothetical protein
MVDKVRDHITAMVDWIAQETSDSEESDLQDVILNLYFSWEFASWLLDHWGDRDDLIEQLNNN